MRPNSDTRSLMRREKWTIFCQATRTKLGPANLSDYLFYAWIVYYSINIYHPPVITNYKMNRKKKNSGGLKREDSIEEVEDEEQSQEQKDIDDYRLVKNEASLSNGSIGAKESKEPEKGVGKGKKKKKVKKEE